MADQSLSLTQQQRQIQILAPQLRQSLELLQVPMLELRTLIQNELQQNPTLEEKPVDTPPVEVEPAGVVDDTKELNFKEEFAILSRLDEEWCRYFMQGQEYEPYDINADKRRRFFFGFPGPERISPASPEPATGACRRQRAGSAHRQLDHRQHQR